MTATDPLLTSSSTILWLKVLLTAASLVLLCVRYLRRDARAAHASTTYSLATKVVVVFAVLLSLGVFYSFGSPRRGTFVHYGEMFHYYLGPKYFAELGHYDLYNAVIAADAEQDGALAGLPFHTDLTTYQNASREDALAQAGRVKARFSRARWRAFKDDVAFFKKETGMPRAPGIYFFLMDHGYNASPVSTLVLGALTNFVPVTHLEYLALLDVLVIAAMIVLVFRSFGMLAGALFAVYFSANVLNDAGYISGGLLRYDWLFCVVAAVCLLERGRYALASSFLTAAAMLKVFPAVLFYGIGVRLFQRAKTERVIGKESRRFLLGAAATALVLFLLPAAYLGSVLKPWQEFGEKTALHDRGVYVNHLGLRGLLLFEPSHLSLERFVQKYQHGSSNDIVRNWQDAKEHEAEQQRPLVLVCSLLVLACLTAIIWRRRAPDAESVLWPLLLIYVASYPSHYYYAFLCLFILLFARRPIALGSLVPLCALLLFNLVALVIDAFAPSPIVFYTVVNACLFVSLSVVLGFELYDAFRPRPRATAATVAEAKPSAKRRGPKGRQRALRRVRTA